MATNGKILALVLTLAFLLVQEIWAVVGLSRDVSEAFSGKIVLNLCDWNVSPLEKGHKFRSGDVILAPWVARGILARRPHPTALREKHPIKDIKG